MPIICWSKEGKTTVEEKKEGLVRALGLKESISMTIGTVVGVGLFTCGSAQIGLVAPGSSGLHLSRC